MRPTKIVDKRIKRFQLNYQSLVNIEIPVRKNQIFAADSYFSSGLYDNFTFYDIDPEFVIDRYDRGGAPILKRLAVYVSSTQVTYQRSVYTLLNMLGDVGGFKEAMMIIATLFLAPVSEHEFNMKAVSKLFLAKTSDAHLLQRKVNDETKQEAKLRKKLVQKGMLD